MASFSYTEDDLRKLFLAKFNEKNQKYICEVPVFCRSIDMVKYNILSHEVTAIEFKLSDWKRAIKQVLKVGICFDFLEICIPKPKTSKALNGIMSSCVEQGIGLYLYNQEKVMFEYVLQPKHTEIVWGIQKANVVNYIKEAFI